MYQRRVEILRGDAWMCIPFEDLKINDIFMILNEDDTYLTTDNGTMIFQAATNPWPEEYYSTWTIGCIDYFLVY